VLSDEIVPTVLFLVDRILFLAVLLVASSIRVLFVSESTTTAVDGDLDQPDDELSVSRIRMKQK
jgi:hypothetical protein